METQQRGQSAVDATGEGASSARITAFGYNVDIVKEARTQRSTTFADDLLAVLRRRRPGDA